MAEEATWQTVVLTPKGKKKYRGIRLVEVTWKVVAAILHRRLTTAITYHDALHGFRAGRGTGAATLEAKLLQQLAAMREEVLYIIFLDLTKAYDALDMSRSLNILEGTGWDHERDGCCGRTGESLRWWHRREGILGPGPRARGESHRAIHYHQPSSMWRCMWWFAAGLLW